MRVVAYSYVVLIAGDCGAARTRTKTTRTQDVES